MHKHGVVITLCLAMRAAAFAAPADGLAESAADAFRVRVERVSIHETRTLEGAARMHTMRRACSLTLRIEAASVEALQAVAGLGPDLHARDDTGLRLSARSPALPALSPTAGTAEGRYVVFLDAPARRATRLTTVDGELILYRTLTPAHVEFDLTAGAGERVETVGGARIFLQHVGIAGEEYRVGVRVETPPGVVLADRAPSLQRAVPVLVTRSGARLRTGRFSTQGGISPEGVPFLEQTLTFHGLREPAVKLVCDAILKSDPDRRIAFQLMDVPLPSDPSADTGAQPPRTRDGESAGRHRPTPVTTGGRAGGAAALPGVRAPAPLAAVGGGTLVSEVWGVAARSGRISFGLSLQERDGWSAVRWVEAPLDRAGTARIAGLRPGRYRIVRTFTAAGARAPLSSPWHNEVVVALVVAGQETRLPPLERVPGRRPGP